MKKNFTFLLALLLMIGATSMYAQQNGRQIQIEGTTFSVGHLLDEIESQANITIVNRGDVIDRGEMVYDETTVYMVRDIVDQVLGGTDFIFYSTGTYTIIAVERQDPERGNVMEHVFVNAHTGQVVRISDVFGETISLEGQDVQVGDMLVGQVLSGRSYRYHSSGTFTIVTVIEDGMRRQLVVDMATRRLVPIEHALRRLEVRSADIPLFDTYEFPGPEYLPRFAIKTNLLYGATTTPNLGIEVLLSRFFTFDFAAGWNPFVYKDNRKFAHLMVQPTLRFWAQEPFNGHFFGLSTMYSYFNVSDIRVPYNWFGQLSNLRNHRFYGHAFSASIQYGHQWVLSPRWSMEASINAGYMLLDYAQFECGWCGEFIRHNRSDHWGITNAAISLIYILR